MSFFFYCTGDRRDLHSFPTRRSSDLKATAAFAVAACADADVRAKGEQLLPLPKSKDGKALPPISELVDKKGDRKSTRLNSSHVAISYAVFCLKKKKKKLTNASSWPTP